jgi:general stress protein 26
MATSPRRSRKSSSQRGAGQRKALAKLSKIMRSIDICMMITRGSRGSFHARPMSNNGEVDFDGDAWFFSGRDTAKVRELARDPAVSLTYVGGTKQKPVWIALSGTASIIRDDDVKREMWVDGLERWFENGPEDPAVVLIKVNARRASWWSYDDEGEVELG